MNADEFCSQELSNITNKHLVAYVLWMQEKGLSASTIKTALAAIRFSHDKIGNAKYTKISVFCSCNGIYISQSNTACDVKLLNLYEIMEDSRVL